MVIIFDIKRSPMGQMRKFEINNFRLEIFSAAVGAIVFIVFCSVCFLTVHLPSCSFSEYLFDDSSQMSNLTNYNFSSQKVKPYLYEIAIFPNLTSQTFSGNCSIYFQVDKNVQISELKEIHLHLGNLVNITKSPTSNTSYIKSKEELVLYFKDNEIKNIENSNDKFILNFEYVSAFSTDNSGLYGTFDTVSSSRGIATQFEATSARRAFPCIDTPSMRAMFRLSLFVEDREMIAISNTEIERVESDTSNDHGKGGRMYTFHKTPPMPPYLVAFAIGKWDRVSGYTNSVGGQRGAFAKYTHPSAKTLSTTGNPLNEQEIIRNGPNTDLDSDFIYKSSKFHSRLSSKLHLKLTSKLHSKFASNHNSKLTSKPHLKLTSKPHLKLTSSLFSKLSSILNSKIDKNVNSNLYTTMKSNKEDKIAKGETKTMLPVDVYTPIGQSARGEFALRLAIESIEFYEDYFMIPYPLSRLQLVSIPDFSAGAMENWGLVTFRDIALLAIDKVSSMSALNRVAEVVVHENAHMWAGDLVSPSAWKDLWLNEGFATLLPHICLEKIDNRFLPWSDFYHETVQEAIEFDFSMFTHPIIPTASSHNGNENGNDDSDVESADSLFDSISYSKGGTVLNMLRQILTENVFRQCLCNYFMKFKYQSATTKDLIDSFEETTGRKIASFVKQWSEKPGFPTIKVTKNSKKNVYILEQERLIIDGKNVVDDYWIIPLSIRKQDKNELEGKGKENIINMESKTTEIPFYSAFIEVNSGRKSMAIIDYSEEVLENDIFPNFQDFSSEARWMLIEDLRLLALAKRRPVKYLIKALNLSNKLKENSYMSNRKLWVIPKGNTLEASNIIDLDVLESSIRSSSFLLSLFGEKLNSTISSLYSFDTFSGLLDKNDDNNNNNHSDRTSLQRSRIRSAVLSLLVFKQKDQKSINFVKSLDWNSIDEEYMRIYLQLKGQNDYDFVHNIYNTTKDSQLKSSALMGLGQTRDLSKIDEIFSKMLFGYVKTHEIPSLLSSLANNEHARKKIPVFLMENFDRVLELFGSGFQMQSIIEISFDSVDNLETLNEMEAFFSKEEREFDTTMKAIVGRANEYAKARLELAAVEIQGLI